MTTLNIINFNEQVCLKKSMIIMLSFTWKSWA